MTKLFRVAVLLALMGALTASAAEYTSGNITVLDANTSSGTATSGSTVALSLTNSGASVYFPITYPYSTVMIDVSGTFTATLTFQSSSDGGSNWDSHTVIPCPVTAAVPTQVTTATAAGTWCAEVAGLSNFRVTATAYTSGTAAVKLRAGTGTKVVTLQNGASVTNVGAAADGAAVSGNPVLVAGQDGTNAQSLLTDSTGRLNVVGPAAENAAVAGNPLLGGGRYDTSARTLDNGDVGALAVDVAGRLMSVGPAAENAAAAGSPLLAGGRYDTSARTLDNGDVGALALDVAGRAQVVGGAADDAAQAGNPVPVAVKAVAAGSQPDSADAGDAVLPISSLERVLYVNNSHPNTFNCNVAVSTATTLTAVGGSCAAPGAGLSLYITDIVFGSSAASSTAADAFPTLKSGTGGTCGTGTAVIWSAMGVANSTIVSNLRTPIKVAANSEVCWIMSEAGSKVVTLSGFIAP